MIKEYYNSPYLNTQQTTISDVQNDSSGSWISIAETIIYPGGGGQLPDKAQINNFNVTEIRSENELTYYRIEKNNFLKIDDNADIRIDWDFRYYNMQQHSGQHLISAVLEEFGLKTISVHLGEDHTMIELSGNYKDELLPVVEEKCNALIRQGLPVKSYWLKKEEAADLPLRKEPGEFDNLRIVEIVDLDYSACGGTHVQKTSEIGLIKIIGLEKIRGNIRLHTKMGRKAYEYLDNLHETKKSLVNLLQVHEEDISRRANAIVEEKNDLIKTLNLYRKKYVPLLAGELAGKNTGNLLIYENYDSAEDASNLARELANEHHKTALIIFEDRFYFASPENHAVVDFQKIIKEHGRELGLRGGGAGGFIQGVFDPRNKQKLFDLITTPPI